MAWTQPTSSTDAYWRPISGGGALGPDSVGTTELKPGAVEVDDVSAAARAAFEKDAKVTGATVNAAARTVTLTQSDGGPSVTIPLSTLLAAISLQELIDKEGPPAAGGYFLGINNGALALYGPI